MDITIRPKKLRGAVKAIPSKSQAHRLLICAAFADNPTEIFCPQTNEDITATANCLEALGAKIQYKDDKYRVQPVAAVPRTAMLPCGESGSTLRFIVPIVGALGVDATFVLAGRLPKRPLSPLWEEMERMGCSLSRPTENTIRCTGKLQSGEYTIPGNISSQYISGLMFALPVLPGESTINITGKLESAPYVQMTQAALSQFGIRTDDFRLSGTQTPHSPAVVSVEGDWSNAAFFLAAARMGSSVTVTGLDKRSFQGDRAVTALLHKLDDACVISAADVPDLIPILAVAAASKKGATFTDISRLRLKESDRVETVCQMLRQFGCMTQTTENTLTVYPAKFTGGTVDSAADHRIAMAAAIAATVATGPVTILGADCVSKSYPAFWDVYKELGGDYEQHIR